MVALIAGTQTGTGTVISPFCNPSATLLVTGQISGTGTMKTLLSTVTAAAIAAAIILPATGAAPAFAASGLKVTPGSQMHKKAGPNRLAQKCKYKRISVSAERLALKMSGYTQIKYLGTNVFQPRCAQFVRFSACKAGQKYQVSVRYIKGVNRYVIAQKVGLCLVIAPKLKLKTQ